MRNLLLLVTFSLALINCKKKNDPEPFIPGKIITKMNYTKNKPRPNNSVSVSNSVDSLYTGFGSYITSITPSKFTAKFYNIRYVDELDVKNHIEVINNNLQDKDPLRYADFTNNSQVTLNPQLYGNLINEETSFAITVTFKYFYFRVQFFYQEVQLPPQYSGIDTLEQFNSPNKSDDENNQMWSSLSNNILKTRYRMFLYPLYQHVQRLPDAFVFGGTDSSYVLNLFTHPHDFPNNLPYDGDYIVRSKNYQPITFYPSDESNKTTYINATMSFDYTDLIQIYAGKDNKPYTKDDVFLYEPKFYDRLKMQVTIE